MTAASAVPQLCPDEENTKRRFPRSTAQRLDRASHGLRPASGCEPTPRYRPASRRLAQLFEFRGRDEVVTGSEIGARELILQKAQIRLRCGRWRRCHPCAWPASVCFRRRAYRRAIVDADLVFEAEVVG